jgi:TctA family transporter
LLTGLFGLPTLLFSLTPRRIPGQEGSPAGDVEILTALKGAAIGGFVGWFPGVTSTSGSVIGSLISRRKRTDPYTSARRFVTMVSAVGTSASVFSLAALAIIGRGRSDTMLAVKDIIGREGLEALSAPLSPELSLLLLSVLISSGIGYVVTIWLGKSLGRRLAGADLRRLTVVIIIVLVALVSVFNGIPGLIVLGVSATVGAIPPLIGVSRVVKVDGFGFSHDSVCGCRIYLYVTQGCSPCSFVHSRQHAALPGVIWTENDYCFGSAVQSQVIVSVGCNRS